MTDINALRVRWKTLFARLGAKGGGMVFLELVRAYAEPHRRAHGPDRLVDVLDAFAHVRDRADDPEAVELALWFSARVVTPGRGRDAAASATRARTAVVEAGLPPYFAERVAALVAGMDTPPRTTDEGVLADSVNAVLAADADTFRAWAAGVEEEGGSLDALRARTPIFHTDVFTLLEDVARGNLGNA